MSDERPPILHLPGVRAKAREAGEAVPNVPEAGYRVEGEADAEALSCGGIRARTKVAPLAGGRIIDPLPVPAAAVEP